MTGVAQGGLHETLLRLGAVVLSEQSVEDILDLVTVLTARALGPARAVGITLSQKGEPCTSNATGEVARTIDHAQYAAGRGPCLQVLREEGLTVNETVESAGERWPEFSLAARAEGVRSVLALPLTAAKGRTVGVLNVYGAEGRPFTDTEVLIGRLLAEQAAIVLDNALAFAEVHQTNGHLLRAVDTRDVIGQAKGVLMARQGCTPDEAFEVLRQASQRTNRKLVEIAQAIADSTQRRPAPEPA